MMYDQTITLFNHRKADNSWRTTVFQGVNVIEPRASDHTTQGTNNGDAVEILLQCSPGQKVGELQYVPPKAYQALTDVSGRFTMTPEVDFIVIGEEISEEPILEDDYDEGLYQAMNDANDGVYMITSATWFGLIPHFEIGGR